MKTEKLIGKKKESERNLNFMTHTGETRYNEILGTRIFFYFVTSVVNKQYKTKEIVSLGTQENSFLYVVHHHESHIMSEKNIFLFGRSEFSWF